MVPSRQLQPATRRSQDIRDLRVRGLLSPGVERRAFRALIACVAASIAATVFATAALAVGPDGHSHSTTAVAYGPIHTGEVTRGEYMEDQDFYKIYTSRSHVQMVVHFGNDFTSVCYELLSCGSEVPSIIQGSPGVCYPFPETGYDRCSVTINVYDHWGGGLILGGGEVVNPGYEWTSEPIELSEPGVYYVGITGDESIESATSFEPLPYRFSLDPAPGLGVDRLLGPPPPPPDVFKVGAIFSRGTKEAAKLTASGLEAYDGLKTDAMIFGLINPEFDISDMLITAFQGIMLDEVANDPPARHYQAVVRAVLPRTLPVRPHGPLSAQAAQRLTALLRSQADVAGFGKATLVAFERFKGAQRANDKRWERIQLRALAKFSSQFATSLSSERSERLAAARVLQALPQNATTLTAAQVEAARRTVAKHGLSPRMRRALTAAGMTRKQQRSIVSRFVHGDSTGGSLVAMLTDQLTLSQLDALSTAARSLSEEANQGIQRLGHTSSVTS